MVTHKASQAMAKEGDQKPKDRWDKADVILKLVGALASAGAVIGVGFFGAQYLAHKQEAESNIRLYTELMSAREGADSSVRKDMFNSIITNILMPEPKNLDQKVLSLQLLAYNFHESLDLAPLFDSVRLQIIESEELRQEQKKNLLGQLKKVGNEISEKEISALAEAGQRFGRTVNRKRLEDGPDGVPVMDEQVHLYGDRESTVRIEALKADDSLEKLRTRLEVTTGQNFDADVTAWVGFYDFPMINNIRLPDGKRCAIVLDKYTESTIEIVFVYFPGSRASLKEKPYYDEIYEQLHGRFPEVSKGR
jgi:hypothetical protein